MTQPSPRNAVDRTLPEFLDGRWPQSTAGCNCGAPDAQDCEPGTRDGGGGQACLWFSQGCTIGCKTCNSVGSHSKTSLCNSTMQPTLPKYAWTMNRWAVPASVNDTYRFNPWRAPGFAPVADACGMAGGTPPKSAGPGEAKFASTKFAKQGDYGSRVLKKGLSAAQWQLGSQVDVAWALRYNHGGGYQYRLCPSGEDLSEECFQRHPLDFVRQAQRLRWTNGTEHHIQGTFVDEGTSPNGSTWAMNPIPRIDFDSHNSGQPKAFSGCTMPAKGLACRQFDPKCPQDRGWTLNPGSQQGKNGTGNIGDVAGVCSGDWLGGEIVDTVVVPKDLPAGDYVLGWRWDCEESTQVWSNCADITLTQ